MKRVKKTIEKRTYALQNAFPRFVSIVTRGANFTPLSELRFSDTNKFADVEINRIEFSKELFTKAEVADYLSSNQYADYTIEETETTFFTPGVETEQFTDIAPVELAPGVMYFLGKLKEPEVESPVNEVTESEILTHAEPEAPVTEPVVETTEHEAAADQAGNMTKKRKKKVKMEDGTEVEVDDEDEAPAEEVTAHADLSPADLAPVVPDQAAVFTPEPEGPSPLEAIQAKFDALQAELALLTPPAVVATTTVELVETPILYTQEQVDKLLADREEELKAAFELEKTEFAQKTTVESKEDIDNESIVIQNRQSTTLTTELSNEEAPPVKDENTLKFEQQIRNNLLGFRN